LYYFAVHAHISLITLGCGIFKFWLQIYVYRAMCWEKSMKFKSSQVKRVSKTSPIGPSRMIQGQNPRTKKEHKTQHSRSVRTSVARGHHGLAVVFTTARGVGGTAMLSEHTVVRPSLLLICLFPLRLFGFMRSFSDLSLFFY